jgi:hypothetical protein
MADRTVDASHINVDTFHETKTVVLKGSVKTAPSVTKRRALPPPKRRATASTTS